MTDERCPGCGSDEPEAIHAVLGCIPPEPDDFDENAADEARHEARRG